MIKKFNGEIPVNIRENPGNEIEVSRLPLISSITKKSNVMKVKFIIACFATMFVFCISCDQDNQSEDEIQALADANKTGIVSEGSVITDQFYSSSLEVNLLGDPAERQVNIYLPKSYNTHPKKQYPVIYFLHGLPAGATALMDPVPFEIFRQVAQLQAPVDFPEDGFTAWVNDLIDNKGMKDVILVMPDGGNRYGLSGYTNSVVQGNYEDYIVKDLVKFIDSNYRTLAHFNFRAITGQCMGAYGALKLAMKHPDVFRYAAGLSPAHFPNQTVEFMAAYMPLEDAQAPFPGPTTYVPNLPFKFINNSVYGGATAWLPNPENPPYFVDLPFTYDDSGNPVLDETLMARWNANSLFALTMNHIQELKKLKYIYFDCGTNDDLMMYQPNLALHQMLEDMHIKHQFETYEGGHISHLYSRLENVFINLSNEFPK